MITEPLSNWTVFGRLSSYLSEASLREGHQETKQGAQRVSICSVKETLSNEPSLVTQLPMFLITESVKFLLLFHSTPSPGSVTFFLDSTSP